MTLYSKQKFIFAVFATLFAMQPFSHSLANTEKMNSNIMGAEIAIVKYPKEKGAGKVRADEFIKLSYAIVVDANVPETRRKMFEVAQHKKTAIGSAASINAKFNLAHDSNIRFLAREEYDGFSVKWAAKVDFMRRFVALGHIPKPLEKHNFYIVVDTDDDQVGDRVYKVFVNFKNKKKSNIKGYASKVDGSPITPLEAKNAGL